VFAGFFVFELNQPARRRQVSVSRHVKWREAREMALRRNAYDLMQLDGRDKERRKQLARLLSRSNKAMREGIQLSEAITVDGGAIFRHACGLGSKALSRSGSARARQRSDARMAENEEPAFRAAIWVTNLSAHKGQE